MGAEEKKRRGFFGGEREWSWGELMVGKEIR
jgi:hypothetical protein